MSIYRIASFNLYKLSENTHKELELIARIIRDNEVDILAIQEIFSKDAMENLLRFLGSNWEGRWASPDSRSVSAAEGYAFVWNKNRIELSRNRFGKVFEPRIHNQYPHKDGIELIRNPYYGRFAVKDNRMIELRLINTHIMFSTNREENESNNHDSSTGKFGAVSMRKKEFEILAYKILPKLEDKAYDYQWGERDDYCRKPYTFLLGDYNLNLRESNAKDTFIDQSLMIVSDSISEKRIVTVQKDLTTLKSSVSETDMCLYRNNFDHFSYDENRPVCTRCWAVDIPNNPLYAEIDYEKYRRDISDHLMIVMELKFI